jgi:hypothetical protein
LLTAFREQVTSTSRTPSDSIDIPARFQELLVMWLAERGASPGWPGAASPLRSAATSA